MAGNSAKNGLRQGAVHTLAQSGTRPTTKRVKIVNGKGTDLDNPEALEGRAKRKTITQSLMLNLVDVSKTKKNHDREKAYWNTFHCQSRIVSANGKLYGNYCKNRFCTLCTSIRKAEMINKYKPIIEQWSDPHFVTLTIRSCGKRRLEDRMDGMVRGFRLIRERCKKRHQRGQGIQIMGIKSLECNFNPEKRTYNPHYHVIVPDKATAELLVEEWLIQWTRKFAGEKGQHIRKVYDTEHDLIETIKYSSKIFTEPNPDYSKYKKHRETRNAKIYAAALDNIFSALKPYRVVERFGFNAPKNPKPTYLAQLLHSFDEWRFIPRQRNWINPETDEVLTNYYPAPELLQMLGFQVDKELE